MEYLIDNDKLYRPIDIDERIKYVYTPEEEELIKRLLGSEDIQKQSDSVADDSSDLRRREKRAAVATDRKQDFRTRILEEKKYPKLKKLLAEKTEAERKTEAEAARRAEEARQAEEKEIAKARTGRFGKTVTAQAIEEERQEVKDTGAGTGLEATLQKTETENETAASDKNLHQLKEQLLKLNHKDNDLL